VARAVIPDVYLVLPGLVELDTSTASLTGVANIHDVAKLQLLWLLWREGGKFLAREEEGLWGRLLLGLRCLEEGCEVAGTSWLEFLCLFGILPLAYTRLSGIKA